jgi:succinate dehydrogenase / fumarate reductase, cytochrome b subunit
VRGCGRIFSTAQAESEYSSFSWLTSSTPCFSAGGPEVYDKVANLYAHPGFMVAEVALLAGVLYHALNGIRIFIIDFTSLASRIQQRLFWIEMVIFFILFVPAAFIMIRSVL